MERVALSAFADAYVGKRVLVTGNTGFKGSWLTYWLHQLGALVTGVALAPPTKPSLFEQAALGELYPHWERDIRDPDVLVTAIREIRPHVVFHLAAQAIVHTAYDEPLETLDTNVMGTIRLLEALRTTGRPCSVVVVTSDKCYENDGTGKALKETDALGGHDPYSASKGCAEIVTASYRRSFFATGSGVSVATARAGNVVGAGDWARHRLIPDTFRALADDRVVPVRHPDARRPWQHVLEPLSGYLWLGTKLLDDNADSYAEAFNFGPTEDSCRPVRDVVEAFIETWGSGRWAPTDSTAAPVEASVLQLDIRKARERLEWIPVWGFDEAIRRTAAGYKALLTLGAPDQVRDLLGEDITVYARAAVARDAPWAGERS